MRWAEIAGEECARRFAEEERKSRRIDVASAEEIELDMTVKGLYNEEPYSATEAKVGTWREGCDGYARGEDSILSDSPPVLHF